MNIAKTGIVRNFDILGRIVIPKEIRKTLRIQDGDPVEIAVSGHSIILEKYQLLQSLENLCEKYLKAYMNTCGGSCVICSTDYVLQATGVILSSQSFLSSAVRDHIQHMEPYHYDAGNPLDLFGDGKYTVDTLYPIGTLKTPAGAVLLLHHGDSATKQLACANMLAAILTELTLSEEKGA